MQLARRSPKVTAALVDTLRAIGVPQRHILITIGAEAGLISVACHPGYAATNLQAAGPRMQGSPRLESVVNLGNRLFAQSAAMGALPTLYAATYPDLEGGAYVGPGGFMGVHGYPALDRATSRARDKAVAARLWQVSEQLTGVSFATGATQSQTIASQICADVSAGGYSTTRNPVKIHCIAFGSLFEPSNASANKTNALQSLADLEVIGKVQSSGAATLSSNKIIVGDFNTRITNLQTALNTIMQVMHGEPVPVRHLQHKCPRDLETICLKCLQKEPRRRYASALALAEDLHHFREDEKR